MIEVNLLPGGKKRQSKKRGFSIKLPQIQGLPSDKWILGSGAAVAVVLVFAVHLFFSTNGRVSDLSGSVEAAVQDSVRYADLIQQTEMLQARRDSIAEKVAIIQKIDAQRYVWAHLMDEVARAVPDYTWLTSVMQVSSGDPMQFKIEGRAGNNFALTRFWNNLESSSFIRNVRLISTEQVESAPSGSGDQEVYQFVLEADFEDPPAELLDMVPLLGSHASLQREGDDADPEEQGTVALAENPDVAGPAGIVRP